MPKSKSANKSVVNTDSEGFQLNLRDNTSSERVSSLYIFMQKRDMERKPLFHGYAVVKPTKTRQAYLVELNTAAKDLNHLTNSNYFLEGRHIRIDKGFVDPKYGGKKSNLLSQWHYTERYLERTKDSSAKSYLCFRLYFHYGVPIHATCVREDNNNTSVEKIDISSTTMSILEANAQEALNLVTGCLKDMQEYRTQLEYQYTELAKTICTVEQVKQALDEGRLDDVLNQLRDVSIEIAQYLPDYIDVRYQQLLQRVEHIKSLAWSQKTAEVLQEEIQEAAVESTIVKSVKQKKPAQPIIKKSLSELKSHINEYKAEMSKLLLSIRDSRDVEQIVAVNKKMRTYLDKLISVSFDLIELNTKSSDDPEIIQALKSASALDQLARKDQVLITFKQAWFEGDAAFVERAYDYVASDLSVAMFGEFFSKILFEPHPPGLQQQYASIMAYLFDNCEEYRIALSALNKAVLCSKIDNCGAVVMSPIIKGHTNRNYQIVKCFLLQSKLKYGVGIVIGSQSLSMLEYFAGSSRSEAIMFAKDIIETLNISVDVNSPDYAQKNSQGATVQVVDQMVSAANSNSSAGMLTKGLDLTKVNSKSTEPKADPSTTRFQVVNVLPLGSAFTVHCCTMMLTGLSFIDDSYNLELDLLYLLLKRTNNLEQLLMGFAILNSPAGFLEPKYVVSGDSIQIELQAHYKNKQHSEICSATLEKIKSIIAKRADINGVLQNLLDNVEYYKNQGSLHFCASGMLAAIVAYTNIKCDSKNAASIVDLFNTLGELYNNNDKLRRLADDPSLSFVVNPNLGELLINAGTQLEELARPLFAPARKVSHTLRN